MCLATVATFARTWIRSKCKPDVTIGSEAAIVARLERLKLGAGLGYFGTQTISCTADV